MAVGQSAGVVVRSRSAAKPANLIVQTCVPEDERRAQQGVGAQPQRLSSATVLSTVSGGALARSQGARSRVRAAALCCSQARLRPTNRSRGSSRGRHAAGAGRLRERCRRCRVSLGGKAPMQKLQRAQERRSSRGHAHARNFWALCAGPPCLACPCRAAAWTSTRAGEPRGSKCTPAPRPRSTAFFST